MEVRSRAQRFRRRDIVESTLFTLVALEVMPVLVGVCTMLDRLPKGASAKRVRAVLGPAVPMSVVRGVVAAVSEHSFKEIIDLLHRGKKTTRQYERARMKAARLLGYVLMQFLTAAFPDQAAATSVFITTLKGSDE